MRTDHHKELSEHLMLVDLARNDLARICTPGSRYVADLTKVDRYSFVMHLVSRVVGELRQDLDVLHARLHEHGHSQRRAEGSRHAADCRRRR